MHILIGGFTFTFDYVLPTLQQYLLHILQQAYLHVQQTNIALMNENCTNQWEYISKKEFLKVEYYTYNKAESTKFIKWTKKMKID